MNGIDMHTADDFEELTCKPFDTYNEILKFLEDPPPWRSLCKELTPHSLFKINNMDTLNNRPEISVDAPETFCHFSPDAEDPKRFHEKKLPKTLVCHDMANGYHDDSYLDGTRHHDAYTFYNWAGIDIFCYFSHHLITVPPVSWINIGHAHGVKVIGTVITEWNEGVKFWDEILSSESCYQDFASALVAVAKCLKFDGWLLNVEIKISKPDDLLKFVQHLNHILHQEIPHGLLIWYDSVTVSGNLNWQNKLNEKNRAFFDACDGIFTNYSWTQLDIASSAEEAADRITDLYIGIDVWGRNFHGGGQFNTQEAIKLAYEKGCSLAIFAPAWSHEAMTFNEGDLNSVAMAKGLDKSEQFFLRDRALWGSFWPFLSTRLPCMLPFKTSFCRGQGKKRKLYGEVICPSPWYNLRHQQYQPNSSHGPHGYLLSTKDVVLSVSCKSVAQENKGIMRCRRESQNVHEKSATHDSIDEDEEFVDRSSEQKTNERNEHEQKTGKRTIKEWLKEFFRKNQASKTTNDGAEGYSKKDGQVEPTSEITSNTSSYDFISSGKSMATVSVNLRLGQSGHPSHARYRLMHVARERPCLEVYQKDSFNGGSCLCINPSDDVCYEHRLTRLFHCDFPCRNSLVVCVVTKTLMESSDQYLNLKLYMKNGDTSSSVVLVGRDLPEVSPAAWSPVAGGVRTVSPLDLSGQRFRDIRKYLLLHEHNFYVPVENSFGWVVRYYEVQFPGSRVTSVNIRTGLERGAILLGLFGICHVPTDPNNSASSILRTEWASREEIKKIIRAVTNVRHRTHCALFNYRFRSSKRTC